MDPQLLARIHAMLGGQSPTTPFSQPPGTTLNSNPVASAPQPMVAQAAQAPGIQNPLTGNNINMGGVGKGIQQLAGALSPQPAQMSQMQTPNLQPHQANPQMLAMLQQQQRPGSPGGGGPFDNTQGQGYA